jgi:hypothetical protein
MNASTAAQKIEARQVADNARLETLPRHFGTHMLTVEDAVYLFMRRLVQAYSGGYRWLAVMDDW